MQVSIPHDLETTLRADLAAILGASVRVYMPPIPAQIQDCDTVIYPVGGDAVSAASDRYDVSIDVYAADYSTATEHANAVRAAISQLAVYESIAGVQYNEAGAGIPYDNYDPRAPEFTRKTFRAWVIMPGVKAIV